MMNPASAAAAGVRPTKLTAEQLELKKRSWRSLTKKRYTDKRKFGFVESQKELLPP